MLSLLYFFHFSCLLAPFPCPFLASSCLKLHFSNELMLRLLLADVRVEQCAFLVVFAPSDCSPSLSAWSYVWHHLFLHDPGKCFSFEIATGTRDEVLPQVRLLMRIQLVENSFMSFDCFEES